MVDLLAWLKASPHYPKIFWASRDNELAIAAAGISENPSAVRFGWRHFIPTTHSEWRDFAPSFFFAPRSIFTKQSNKTFLTSAPRYHIEKSSSNPSRSDWIKTISKAILAIENKQFEKVVLGRRVTIDCSTPIDPFQLCQCIKSQNQTIFLIQPTPDSVFIGATPEMLYQRRGKTILCDALAGTKSLHQKEALLSSAKDQREFFIVQNGIIKALSPYCQSGPAATGTRLQTSSQICHLYSQITGQLKDGVTDEELLDALHPTPAMGGYPMTEALDFIRQNEPFDRGLYAAPLGWIGPDRADFAVGIRSCLIQGNRAYLYSGTGIVEGSHPIREWEELEQKISHWMSFYE